MTREEEIKKAIDIQFPKGLGERTNEQALAAAGFELGVHWADNHPVNVWHDSSEEPKIGSNNVAIDKDGQWWDIQPYNSDDYDGYGLKGWPCCSINYNHIQKWAYISDLLPK